MKIIGVIALLGAFFVSATALGLDAIYEVPTRTDLKQYSTSTIDNAQWSEVNGIQTLSFLIPDNLAGNSPIRIELGLSRVTARGFLELEGRDSSGICLSSPEILTCMIKYDFVVYNAEAIVAYLQEKYTDDPDELAGRVAVVRQFASEPAGIIEVQLDE